MKNSKLYNNLINGISNSVKQSLNEGSWGYEPLDSDIVHQIYVMRYQMMFQMLFMTVVNVGQIKEENMLITHMM